MQSSMISPDRLLNLRVRLRAKPIDCVLRFTHSIVLSQSIARSGLMRVREVNSPVPSRWIGCLDYAVFDALVFQLHGPT